MPGKTEASTQTQSVDELFKKLLAQQDEIFKEIDRFWDTQWDKVEETDPTEDPKEFMEAVE